MADIDFSRSPVTGLNTDDIVSGIFGIARIPTGTSGTTVALGDHTHAGIGAHTHPISDVTDLQNQLDAKALSTHNHDSAYVALTGSQTIAGAKTISTQWIFNSAPQIAVGSLVSHPVRRDDTRLTDARTPTAHVHAIADVTSLQTSLDGKSATGHTHSGGGLVVYTVPGTTGAIALDAVNGNHQIVTMGGARTIGSIAGGTNGMKIIVEYVQDATGSRLLTHTVGATNAFSFGADLPIASTGLSSGSNLRDIIGYIFNSAINRWMVTSIQRGFNTTG